MTGLEQNAFAKQALKLGLAGICLDALETCISMLKTPVPDSVRKILGSVGEHEPASSFLAAGQLERSWIEFQSLPGWSSKWLFVRENLFPSAKYMRRKYPDAQPRTLPLLYLKRAVDGIKKRVSSSRVRRDS